MNYAAFFSYVLLTAFTPGPNNIMAMSNASKYGFKRAFPFNVGVLLGFLLVMAGCATFTSLLYQLVPTVKPAMLVIGALYILWLAYTVWRDKPHAQGRGLAQTNTVLAGMALQFVNVKVILYGITAMSSFILPYYRDIPTLMLFIVMLTVIGFVATCCWALFGSVFERFFKKYSKWVNAGMALLLMYCAFTMVEELFN